MEDQGWVDVAASRAHDQALQWCQSHRRIHALTLLDRRGAGAVTQMQDDQIELPQGATEERRRPLGNIAVRSAVEVQEEIKARNAELPENRKMEFRIGINLGDVIHEEKRIYGDGVNVAARVESLADAGGICVS